MKDSREGLMSDLYNHTTSTEMTHLENNSNTILSMDTNSTDIELFPDIKQPVFMIVIYSIAYGIIFLFALFGNLAVIAVVSRTRRLHTLTNFFIGNLAVADILVAVFCIPISLLQNLYNGRYLNIC